MGTIRERDWKGGKAWQLRYTDADGKRRSEQFQYKHDAEARVPRDNLDETPRQSG
jgi:hypothetical protein